MEVQKLLGSGMLSVGGYAPSPRTQALTYGPTGDVIRSDGWWGMWRGAKVATRQGNVNNEPHTLK